VSRILLTGGSGFIGGETVEAAIRSGHQVLIFDVAKPHFDGHLPHWAQGDIRNPAALYEAASRFEPDAIIHLASDTDVQITQINQFTTTIEGTRNVIEMARQLPSLKKLVHISTQFVVKPGVEPASETSFEPYTVYGAAKAETERMIRAAGLAMPWLILRPTIIWGPHHPSFRENIFRHIESRFYLHPVGRTKILRAFGYVHNTAQQILMLTMSSEGDGAQRVFYVGDDVLDYDVWADKFSVALTGKPARRISQRLLSMLGRTGDFVKRLGLPAPIDSGRAFRMSTSSAIDLSSTLAITGEPKISLDQGVMETVNWLRNPTLQ
jgi:nucleoside-diphosphate-sugar epimerase